MRGRTIAYIFETIENLERELAFLKTLVQQSISVDDTVEDSILVDAEYFLDETEQDILVDAEIIADAKPPAKPTRKEQRLEARRRATEWAKTLPRNENNKRASDTAS